MRNDNRIHVVNATLKSQTKTTGLNKIQKWICKLFSIEPRCWYHQEFDLLLPLPYFQYGGGLGDVLIFDSTDDTWRVLAIHSRKITLVTMDRRSVPRTEREFRGMEGVIVASTIQEVKVR